MFTDNLFETNNRSHRASITRSEKVSFNDQKFAFEETP